MNHDVFARQPQSAAAATLSVALLVFAAPAVWAQAGPLAAPAERIADTRIQSDHQGYEAAQRRLQTLNAAGTRIAAYPLALAQCWLDVSWHEYSRNDRSAFPQAALDESARLATALERGNIPARDVPLVNDAPRLREDLWRAFDAVEQHSGAACAQQALACGRVELVHAGNEYAQFGWRHANPYVQMAEDRLATAQAQAAACSPTNATKVALAAPAPAPLPAPTAPTPAAVRQLSMQGQVLFNFDRHAERDARPFSVVQLEQLVARAKASGMAIERITLAGHADRLNGTGNSAYNMALSQKRVATVRDMLVRQGVPAARIEAAARGDGEQLAGCENRFTRGAELQECLLPNRRVDVRIDGTLR